MARLPLQPLLVAGALSLHACACVAQQPAVSAQAARGALEDFADRAHAHGASGVLLVADRDSILVHRAMGWRDPERRLPNDTSTLFYIASLAKQFVAAAVLRLEQDGRLRTSDSLPAFFADVPPDKRRITIDQLLAHTAAFGRYGFDPVRRDWAVQDRDHAVAGILRTPLTGEPGVRFDYQNANYLLLAAIVERVTRVPLEDYLGERPVGARDTYIGRYVTPELRSRVAWSLGDEAESFSIIDRTPTWLSHGRGVVTTAADLYRWLRGIERGVVLSDAARRKLYSIRAPFEPGYGYAAGWFVRADSTGTPRIVFHRGDFRSYHSEARVSPTSGRISIAFTNAAFRGASITESLLNKAAASVRHGEDSLPVVVARPSDAVAPLAGEYISSAGDAILVGARRGSLVVTPVGQASADWLMLGDTVGIAGRHDAGARTLALVHQLAHGRTHERTGRDSLPAEQRRELAEEWNHLTRGGGRLKSYQLLGTTRNAADSTDVSIVRLKFQRDSLMLAVGWKNGAPAYTAPGTQNLVAPSVFAPAVGDEWLSADWLTGEVHRLTIDRSTIDRAPTLTLHTRRGAVIYTRR